jgi:hypothetical protein
MIMAIYSYLQGGLGNQMFQYAIARALSERYQTAFILNRSWFGTPQGNATPRELQLNLLNIQDIQFIDEIFPKKLGKIARILQPFLPTQSLVIYQRNAFDFDPTLFKLKNVSTRDLYISGYWQAFPYIDAIREQLKEEFKTRSAIADSYQDYLQKIHTSESVMVHIRRGDYVHSPAAAQYHGTLPIHYYQTAIQDLLAVKPNAHLFIFSDDLMWAKEALGASAQKTYIEHTSSADAAAQELQLMFACKHHIIANSSLSWWGAWLKQEKNGLVLAPNRWINDQHLDLSNLLPAEWKKVLI